MPKQKASNLINAIEQGKVSDEEFVILKRLVEKRDREAVQVTVTQVNTVQHSSRCPLDPKPSPDVCVNLESSEGTIDPELKELESPSAGTGLKTPGQQCPPNEGAWEQGRTTANGFLTAGVGSSQGGRNPSPPERSTSTRTFADIFSTAAIQETAGARHLANRTNSSTPVGKKRRPRLETRLYSTFFLGGELGGYLSVFCLCFVLCAFCMLCFPNYFSFPGE